MRRLASLGILLLGCSSGFKYTIEDQTIAGVPLRDRQGVLQAQAELAQAQDERTRSHAALERATGAVTQSERDRDQAEKDLEKAMAEQKTAAAGADINRMNTANRNKEVAAAGLRAAEAKIELERKRERAARAQRIAADRHVVVAQARYELEKARVVQAQRLRSPSHFQLSRFEDQYQDADRDYQAVKNEADLHTFDAHEAEKGWQEAEARHREMKGER